MRLPFALLPLVFPLFACSGTSQTSLDPSSPPLSSDGGAAGAGGSGSISGTADGKPFTTVTSALWLGAPDSPDTTVVYVFSKPVACADIGAPGWDGRITDGTQFLEMKMFGNATGTFNAVAKADPAAGEVSVNYTDTASAGDEILGSGGNVTLATLSPSTKATGTFTLSFGPNQVKGAFGAAYCPGGREP